MTKLRFLLTGAAGQVGFELRRSLTVLGEVIAVDHRDCDLADAAAVTALLDHVRPDVIVNPAAYTAVDKAESESELAFAVNAKAPATMADWARQNDVLLVHYSTDYVFDGNKDGRYVETDLPNPQSVYGRSKLEGEEVIRASGCRALTLRTSWVFGAHGGNFLKTMLRLMAERDSLGVVADQVGAPTAAGLIADVSAQLVAQYLRAGRPMDFPFGTYHLAAAGETSWHGYACEINRLACAAGFALRCPEAAIRAIPRADYPLPAPRPANSRLDTNKLQITFGVVLPDWRQGVRQVIEQLKGSMK